ncbi:MAG: GNAT family N-acetyltransferase [Bacteroidetes bacterium]|nr:MAG: GNAT family N-acetyltransferase [Bacteroidota bacterium]REK07084.1 MAG: GNAT family N-acetyltransferase [Bacteroidota bacterium]REK33741.1 MAG: GNAT family N-acetyltransferase [Bacteroidota bacterium]REK48657.1 MAG: GNAT family N-acetyltransferase [Bacteroidota bacterium]
MQALRPHLVREKFAEKIKAMQSSGYRMIYVKGNNTVPAVAGFRFSEHLAWGKIIYIDDLSTHPDFRGKGFATALLDYILIQAKSAGCKQIHLDSGCGPQRYDAHRLYLKYGFNISSHHFTLDLK